MMKSIWIIFTIGLSAFLSGTRICVKALKEDGYLENWQSGDGRFDDDEDFGSGSGSDIFVDQGIEKVTKHAVFLIPGTDPSLRSGKAAVAQEEMLTYTKSLRTETTVPATKNPLGRNGAPGSSSPNLYGERDKVSSESLFQRTEVLAAVITGGVIGLAFAVFLVLLLVYRMRKKDEGSYELGERKAPSAAYQKAPTKEFYA
ncbi:syndecan-2-like isoform X1 [Paramormyrops kingsleyae]|uniref:Syndecan n=1 Tax=Paramormyrops kingsleyae TaxID=1676925 RepID=A0A3B3QKS8_9TELE|nr:syndecan-2-like isoform X1 [Paramormyrops kingsleyae]